MDTLGFLQRVLPSEGYYVSIVVNPDGRKQGFSDCEELATLVQDWTEQVTTHTLLYLLFVQRKTESKRM